MAASTNLNGLSDTYQLYRLNVSEEVLNDIGGARKCGQNPPPEVHVQMSALHREFRDRYIKILITKEEGVPLSYDEYDMVDHKAFKVTWAHIGWKETLSKMQKLIAAEDRSDKPLADLYHYYFLTRESEIGNSAACEILIDGMSRLALSTSKPVTSDHVQECLQHIYRFLSVEDAAKCARVGQAWNRTTKMHVREVAHQYAYGLKEFETCLFEGLGPQAVCSHGGIEFGSLFKTMRGSDASSAAFFRSREMVKHGLTLDMTTHTSNFAIVQAALSAIMNVAACSHVFKQDVADCVAGVHAQNAIWKRPREEGHADLT